MNKRAATSDEAGTGGNGVEKPRKEISTSTRKKIKSKCWKRKYASPRIDAETQRLFHSSDGEEAQKPPAISTKFGDIPRRHCWWLAPPPPPGGAGGRWSLSSPLYFVGHSYSNSNFQPFLCNNGEFEAFLADFRQFFNNFGHFQADLIQFGSISWIYGHFFGHNWQIWAIFSSFSAC